MTLCRFISRMLREFCLSSSRDVTLGDAPLLVWLVALGLFDAWSSFCVASDFQEFLQRFDEVLAQCSRLGQMLWLGAASRSAIFKQSREQGQRAGIRFLKGLTSEAFRSTPRGFHQPGCPSGRRSTYTAHFPCSKFICLVILSHEENIF